MDTIVCGSARGTLRVGNDGVGTARFSGLMVPANFVAMGALVVGAVAAFAQGGFAITYFPTIVWPSAGAAVLMGAVCYGAFLAIPAVTNCGGRALWRYSLSKS